MKSFTLTADLLLLFTAAIWGFAFVAQRVGMEHVGPFTYNGVRFALGCLSLVPLLMAGRRLPQPVAVPVRSRLFLFGGGALGLVLFVAVSLQQVALLYTTAGKAGFITGLYVVFVPLLGLIWRQRPKAGTWVGAVSAAAGLYLLSVTEGFSIAFGDGLVLVSALFWSVQVLLVAYLSPRVRPVDLAFYQFSICALLSLLTAGVVERFAWSDIRAAAGPILYGGVLSVGVAYTLQVVAQRNARPAHASILMSLEAVFAALGGWWILDERLSLRALVGCGLMLAGMLFSQLWALRK
ncbi:MAG: DMT family transporter [Desulfobacteraceae bacterium]|nr:MAG: DMT family transporter [Desulfobacteraceae bacterium]